MSIEQQTRQVTELVSKLLVISQQMTQRGAELDQRSAQVEQALLRTERNVQSNLSQAETHIKRVTEASVAQAVQKVTHAFELDIKNITNSLIHTANQLQKSQQETAMWLKALVWKALAGLVLASVVTVAGLSYVAWDRMDAIKNANFGKDILDATKAGAITLCDGSLCVRADKNAKRFGGRGEFVLVDK